MAKIRVAVLFGGASKDYDVSLQSAYSVLKSLDKSKYEAVPIGITKAGRWLYYPSSYDAIPDGSWENDSDCCCAVLSPDRLNGGLIKVLSDGEFSTTKIDCVFSLIHGKYGECGRIQGLCKLANIAFVGSEPEAANACVDKALTHLILDKAGIKTARFHIIDRSLSSNHEEMLSEIESRFQYPVYVKAASCSSSIGTNFARNREELLAGLKIAFSHHKKALIEEQLVGKNLECAVFGNSYSLETSQVGEIVPDADSASDYIISSSQLVIPAQISESSAKSVKETALNAFKALGCKGLARVDFVLTANGIFCIKVCNIPGFCEENIFPSLMKASGYEYGDVLDMMITLAIEARE